MIHKPLTRMIFNLIKPQTQPISSRSLSNQSTNPVKLNTYNGASPLYIHSTESSSSSSISFLSKPPISLSSPTILGSISSATNHNNQTIKFQPNPSFLELIHQTFQNTYLSDPYLIDLAKSRQDNGPDGYIHLFDQRQSKSDKSHRGGPSAESIIFSFLVNAQTGLPLPNTYQPNPVYRIWTPNEGFLILPESLQNTLLKSSELVYQIESEDHQ